jgi:hypothetical protein
LAGAQVAAELSDASVAEVMENPRSAEEKESEVTPYFPPSIEFPFKSGR